MSPTEEEWTTHEETIRRLYYESTRVRLMAHMEQQYGFTASKAQYERKFAEWALRKNVKALKGEWTYIIVKKRKREELGKDSIFKLNGCEISADTIRKRQNRCTLTELQILQDSFPVLDPPTPEGISVATPPRGEIVVPSPTTSLQFPSRCSDNECSTLREQYVLSYEFEPVPGDIVKQQVVYRQVPTHNLPYFCYVNLMSSIDSSGALISFLDNSDSAYGDHMQRDRLLQFEDDDLSFTNSVWDLDQSNQPIGFISPPPDNMIWKLFTSQPQVFQFPSTKLELQRSLLARLRPTILEQEIGELDRQLERLFGPSDKACFLEFLNLVVYFVSNELLLLHERTSILEWLLRQGKPTLRRMMSIPLPTVRSFLVDMVDTAIEISDYEAGRDLLDADTHQGLYFNHVERLLRAAVSLNHTEMVQKIIRVYPNHCLELQNSILSASRNCTGALEMTKVLLEAGANVDGPGGERLSPLEAALWAGNSDLVHLLVRHDADVNRTTFGCSIMFRAIGTGNAEIVECLVKAGALCLHIPQNQGNLPLPGRTNDDTPKTELQLAAFMGCTKLMVAVLSSQQATEGLRLGDFRWAPLRDAAESRNCEVVKLLLSAGADSNAKSNIEGVSTSLYDLQRRALKIRALPQTALLAAIEEGDLEVVKILTTSKAELNAIAFSEYGCCAFEVAYNLGHLEIVDHLKIHGAIKRLPPVENGGVLALRLAVRRGDLTRAKLFISKGVPPVSILDNITTPLAKREFDGVRKALSIFLQVCDGNVDVRTPLSGESPLEIALRLRDFAAARYLISAGCMVNQEYAHVFRLFGLMNWWDSHDFPEDEKKQFMAVDMLKEMWTTTGNSVFLSHALHIASSLGDLHLVKHIVSIGAIVKVQVQSNSPKHIQRDLAAYKPALNLALQAMRWKGINDYSVVKYLLDQGADPNEDPRLRADTLKKRTTALELATWIDAETVRLLLDSGADINTSATGHMGRTALQAAVAVKRPSLQIIELLLQRGADINARPSPERGITALQGAAIEGHTRIALILLERGADPNAPGAEIHGRTALEGAAEQGRLDMVQLLLNADAEPQESATRFAEDNGHFVIADIIRERMRG